MSRVSRSISNTGSFRRTLYVRSTGQAVGTINSTIGFTVGNLSFSTSLPVSGVVNSSNSTTPLILLGPTYNCQTGAFTFNTQGGNGSPIEFMAIGITGWTTNPNGFVDIELRTALDAQPITLRARQNGVEATYAWDLRAQCPLTLRMATYGEPTPALKAMLYPNPVGEVCTVHLEGAKGQTVQFIVTDLNGTQLLKRTAIVGDVHHQETFRLEQAASGLYLLRISAENQPTVVLKVLKR